MHRQDVFSNICYLHGLADATITKRCPILDEPQFRHLRAEQVAHGIKELIKQENKKRMHQQIGIVLQPDFFNQGGLTRVDVPADGIEEPFPIGSDPR